MMVIMSRLLKAQGAIAETDKAVAADDDVVYKIDLEVFAGYDVLAGEGDILG